MNYFKAVIALLKGLGLCIRNREVRKLALRPWFFGFFIYLCACTGAYYAHAPLFEWIVGSPQGFWGYTVYYLAMVMVPLTLLIATMIITIPLVMLLTAVFQTDIAIKVLGSSGFPVPEEDPGAKGIAKEASRSVIVEAKKLLWLLPLMLFSVIMGFFPLLTLFAIVLASWLLAYEFVDVVLDIYKTTSGERFRFALKNSLLMICFGLTLTACWAVPFLGLFLPPVAVSAAAWLLSTTGLLDEFMSK